jgi:hypothetical protein
MVYRTPTPSCVDRWTCGFIDREGCFSISFFSNSKAFRMRLLVIQKGSQNLPVRTNLKHVFSGVGAIEKHSRAVNWLFVISGCKNCYSVYPYFKQYV